MKVNLNFLFLFFSSQQWIINLLLAHLSTKQTLVRTYHQLLKMYSLEEQVEATLLLSTVKISAATLSHCQQATLAQAVFWPNQSSVWSQPVLLWLLHRLGMLTIISPLLTLKCRPLIHFFVLPNWTMRIPRTRIRPMSKSAVLPKIRPNKQTVQKAAGISPLQKLTLILPKLFLLNQASLQLLHWRPKLQVPLLVRAHHPLVSQHSESTRLRLCLGKSLMTA